MLAESEVMVLFAAIALAAVGLGITRTGGLHRLYFRGNPAPGLVRLAVLASLAWLGLVLWRYADPSVVGVYVLFYLVLGYAAIKLFGQAGAALFGLRFRVDAGERRNVPAGLVIAAFTLATGLIFGGSLWGEADPVGDDEGGWWIPVGFFLLGWGVLAAAFALFLRREPGRFAHRIHRDRSMPDARAAAAFLLASAIALTDAVSGDFWGWRHGLLTFGLIAVMLLAHEVFAALATPGGVARSAAGATGAAAPRRRHARRMVESVVYLGLGVLVWALNRLFDRLWTVG